VKKTEVENHVLVPKHEVLDEESVKKVLEKYNILKKDLPRILENDTALKEVIVKKGDVIKITRTSPVIGTSIYYRVVVEAK